MVFVILAAAVLVTFKYFPGFEHKSDLQAGLAYQTIHPEAFAGDPYFDPERPLKNRLFEVSLLYGAVAVLGDIWLDDRFAALVFAGLLFAALLAIDRIAQLLGAQTPILRLIILMFCMKDHTFLGPPVNLFYVAGIDYSSLAIPLTAWLLWAALAGKGLFIVTVLSCLLAAASFQNVFFPVIFALGLAAAQGGVLARVGGGVAIAAALGAVYAALFHVYAMPTDARLELWDLMIETEFQHSSTWVSVSGFGKRALQNGFWILLCAGAFFAAGKTRAADAGAARGLRRFMLYAGVIWFAVGAYIPYAPDALKFPLLIEPISDRALIWPQYLAMMTVIIAAADWAQNNPAPLKTAAAGAVLAVLFLAGPGNPAVWGGLFAVGGGAYAAFAALQARRAGQSTRSAPMARINRPAVVLAAALALPLAFSHAAAAWRSAPEWLTWAQHGVHGRAASAAWIGVVEFFRRETPETASVLTFRLAPNVPGGLFAERSISTRLGRPMPVPNFYTDYTSLWHWREFKRVKMNLFHDIGGYFTAGDAAAAVLKMKGLAFMPDYLVLPEAVIGPQLDAAFPYVKETDINGWTILRRTGG